MDGMCAGRGLPEAMSEETVATIDATAATVAPHALEITSGPSSPSPTCAPSSGARLALIRLAAARHGQAFTRR